MLEEGDAALGALMVIGVIVAWGVAVALVHVAVRPRDTGDARVSDALRNLEPRGGRHRFSLRHFEGALLFVLWWTALGLLLVCAPLGVPPSERTLAVFGASAAVLTSATWWLWRRGALRPPQPRQATEGPASRVRRRRRPR